MRTRKAYRLSIPSRTITLGLAGALSGAGSASEPAIRFEDITERAGITFVNTIGDGGMSSLVESTGMGCGLLDYDNDGWLDIYLVNGTFVEGMSNGEDPEAERAKSASDRLYRNLGRGDEVRFEDVTEKAGILPGGYGIGVLTGDYDNDGHVDIYVPQFGPNRLYRNRGDGTFEEVAAQAGVADPRFSVGCAYLDYDLDGDLDLFVGNYVEFDIAYNQRHGKVNDFVGPLSFPPEPDQLYRNNGDGTFTNVTESAGLNERLGRAMGVGSFDFDGDGWPDIFVANDAMENHLYRNRKDGTFEEAASLAGVAFGGSGEATGAMAVEFGDVTGDGRIDIYVPDFTTSCLYINLGGGFFEDQSVFSGIARACRAHIKWGTAMGDFDHDGDLDLYVVMGDANGLIPYEDRLLANHGKGQFRDVSATGGKWFEEKRVGRGVARGDVDNDGDLDLLVENLNAPPALLLNTTSTKTRHWLMLKLVGRSSNRDAVGARVECELSETATLVHEVCSAGSYVSSHDRRVHFGLGDVDRVSRVTVRWPSGRTQTLVDVKADRMLTIEEPAD